MPSSTAARPTPAAPRHPRPEQRRPHRAPPRRRRPATRRAALRRTAPRVDLSRYSNRVFQYAEPIEAGRRAEGHLAATNRGDRLQQRPAGLDRTVGSLDRLVAGQQQRPQGACRGGRHRQEVGREAHRPHPGPDDGTLGRPRRASATPAPSSRTTSHHGATEPSVPPPRFRHCPPRQRGHHGRHDGVRGEVLLRVGEEGSWVGEGQLHGPTVCRRTSDTHPLIRRSYPPVLSASPPLADPCGRRPAPPARPARPRGKVRRRRAGERDDLAKVPVPLGVVEAVPDDKFVGMSKPMYRTGTSTLATSASAARRSPPRRASGTRGWPGSTTG